jgi:hypothetical protein
MTNLDILQKLTLGIENVQTIEVELPTGKEEMKIRPLTDGELTKLRGLEQRPYKMKIKINREGKREAVERNNSDIDLGMGEFTEYQTKAMYTAVAWSLSIDETVEVSDIESLPKGIPELLFKEVIEISNLKDSDLTSIKQFRNNK